MSNINNKSNFKNEFALFGLSNSKTLAEDIANNLKVKLDNYELLRFADGELLCVINSSVRGKDVHVIQSTSYPVNDSLMELLIFLDAVKRASAKSVTVYLPYYGYARQDRKAKGRQPITAKLVADLIQVAGANRLVSFDLHSPQIQGFFNIPVDNLKGLFIIANYFNNKKLQNVAIISPDVGGIARARELVALIKGSTLSVIDKQRKVANYSEVMNILGDIEGKDCILIDDMIDTGGTIFKAAKALKEQGAKDIYIAATHGIFSNQAIENLSSDFIKEVIITDTIWQNKTKLPKKIVVLTTAYFLSDVIRAEHFNESLSNIYIEWKKIIYQKKIKN